MGKVSLSIMLFLSLVASLTVAQNTCGKDRPCEDYSCCSQSDKCGLTIGDCTQNCQSNCIPYGEVFTTVTTYYYDMNQNNYTFTGVDDCKPWLPNKSFEWRSRYEWAAFNAAFVELPLRAACGRCLKVTNSATEAQTTVRIVASAGTLDLDTVPFNQIDTDGQGFINGHLIVSYEFVLCGDEDEPELISMVV